jgi:hypothetical protein
MTRRRGKTGAAKGAEPTDGDNSDFDIAFKALARVAEAREKSRTATSSAMRTIQQRTIREQSAKFEALTDRDWSMTRLLAAFLRRDNPQLDAEGEIKRWLHGEADFKSTYTEFFAWCAEERIRLDELEQRRPLSPAEVRLVSDLDEIDEKAERTAQYRLQKQFGAKGERGRPRKNTSNN